MSKLAWCFVSDGMSTTRSNVRVGALEALGCVHDVPHVRRVEIFDEHRARTLWALDATEVLQVFARECALAVINLWAGAPSVVLRFLRTGNNAPAAVACADRVHVRASTNAGFSAAMSVAYAGDATVQAHQAAFYATGAAVRARKAAMYAMGGGDVHAEPIVVAWQNDLLESMLLSEAVRKGLRGDEEEMGVL